MVAPLAAPFLPCRPHDVLRAGIGDAAVDDGQFAMISQVEACEQPSHRIDRQGGDDLDSLAGSSAPGAEEPARADRVGEQAAAKPRSRPGPRPPPPSAHLIRRENVEEQMHVVLCWSMSSSEAIDHGVGLGQEFGRVPFRHRQTTQLGGDVEDDLLRSSTSGSTSAATGCRGGRPWPRRYIAGMTANAATPRRTSPISR